MGKLSGRHAFREELTALGYSLSDQELQEAFVRFKRLADQKKELFEEDLETMVGLGAQHYDLLASPEMAPQPSGD